MDDATSREATGEHIDERLNPGTNSGVMVWEVDGEPVAMTGHSGDTGRGIRVNMVYTPPAHRGEGYASALCAAQAETPLGRGYEQIHLFTDLASPTSNRIDQRIGYRPMGSCERYRVTRTDR